MGRGIRLLPITDNSGVLLGQVPERPHRNPSLPGRDYTSCPLRPVDAPPRHGFHLAVSGPAVTMVARKPLAGLGNDSLSRLWRFAPDRKGDGLRRSRVSCNRGEELAAAAARSHT